MRPIVLYHSPCLDGFTAAWAIWLNHPDWEFVPMKYGDPLPDLTGRDVYFVDFSVKRAKMIEVIENAKSVYVFDHHKTAQEDLAGLAEEYAKTSIHFDMDKSGAQLAWEYFHNGKQTPAIIKFVEDRDLWRFKYPETKAVNAYLFAHNYDFEFWKYLARDIEENLDFVEGAGNMILRKEAKDVQEYANTSWMMNIGGWNVPVVNVPYMMASDICHYLGKGEPFAASFYFDGNRQKVIFSLRSAENGVDVSEIAKQYGGGGHKHAAGFEIPIKDFGEKMVLNVKS